VTLPSKPSAHRIKQTNRDGIDISSYRGVSRMWRRRFGNKVTTLDAAAVRFSETSVASLE
jgi:hypothetical protein